jgi:hypothetical protein
MERRYTNEQLNWLIQTGRKIPEDAETYPIPVKEFRWFISTFIAANHWQEVGKNIWMFKPGKRSEQIWQISKKNSTLADVKAGKTVAKKQPVTLEDFTYAFLENTYVHKPSRMLLTSKELNRLFPRVTWPTLNGTVRRPSNFIRRHQRVMYLSDVLGANNGEKPAGKSTRSNRGTEGVSPN